MKIDVLYILILVTLISNKGFAQNYPLFGPEKKVTVTGYLLDAMEPFIAADANTIFFNSLNSGGNTNLHFATKVNDTTFNYAGLTGGTYDTTLNHLDAVASVDSSNNFFWVSLRGYPTVMENLHRGSYAAGNVTGITRVYGDFNIYSFNYPFGWLIMDAAVNYQGDRLYYCNALFDFSNTSCPGIPCEAKLGVAQMINDSTFNKLPVSDFIFSNVNDTAYLVYAPQVSSDGLQLYFTRLLKNSFNTEICVAVRNTISDAFSLPMVIHSAQGYFPEAPSPTTDQQKMYYHQKDSTGRYNIYLRYKTGSTSLSEDDLVETITLFPNPATSTVTFHIASPGLYTIQCFDVQGKLKMELQTDQKTIELCTDEWNNGMYLVRIINGKQQPSGFVKFIKQQNL